MNLFAGNILLSLWLTLIPVVPDGGGVRCTCRPSPPGGVTECESGQIAVCNSEGGVCKGSCFSVSAQLEPLPYSAALLTKVLAQEVSVEDLKKDSKSSKRNLEQLIKGSQKDEPVKLKYQGVEHLVSVGLTEVAINKLKAASSVLVVSKSRIGIGVGRPW